MLTQPQVAFVIPTYNHLDYALISAKTALAHTPNSVVMVVDDASPEWSQSIWNSLPQDRLIIHRFPKNDKNLTRSWNWGLSKARELKIPITVATNSDVIFPKNWFQATEKVLLENRADLVGPVTNAPGHRPNQQIASLLTNYKITDDLGYLNQTQNDVFKKYGYEIWPTLINGFCVTALTEKWWSGAFSEEHVFRPDFKMIRNEDELEGRWLAMGRVVAIVPGSFVWHYRGVTRNSTFGAQGKGWFRRSNRKGK